MTVMCLVPRHPPAQQPHRRVALRTDRAARRAAWPRLRPPSPPSRSTSRRASSVAVWASAGDLLGRRRAGTAASPDWRVPSISPAPRSRRSSSAMRKPSLVSRISASRARAVSLSALPRSSRQIDSLARRARPGRAAGGAGRGRSARRPRRSSAWHWARRRRPRSPSSRPAPTIAPRWKARHHRVLLRPLHPAVDQPDLVAEAQPAAPRARSSAAARSLVSLSSTSGQTQ